MEYTFTNEDELRQILIDNEYKVMTSYTYLGSVKSLSFRDPTTKELIKVMGERIINGDINPRTDSVYNLDEITNEEHKGAVGDYLSQYGDK